jgi:protocatechuate 3,4-dioxygenase beta subunit
MKNKMAIVRMFLTVALCPLPFALLTAQVRAPQTPTRDAAPAPTGTGMITGVVVTDDANAQPLRRVSVTLGAGGLQIPQTTVTDDTGRFAFAGLAPGNYTLVASRPGYVPAFYGAKQPGQRPGVPIAVLDGQRVTDVRVRLLHGSVITGIVRRQDGQPAPGVDVMVLQVQTVNGERRATPIVSGAIPQLTGNTSADDRGVYRVFGLAPGEYLVQTQMRGTPMGPGDARQVTPSEIQWAQQAIAQAPSGVPPPGAPPLAVAPEPGATVAYSPVYYPGTTVAADAATVAVGPNEERGGVDVPTMLVPTAKITGLVVDPEGRPLPGAQVVLQVGQTQPLDIMGLMSMGENSASAGPDGTFVLTGVRPGRYKLTARGAPRPERGAAVQPDALPAALLAVLGGATGATVPWWAMEDIAVDGHDISGVTLRMQPGMTVSGKIIFEGRTPPPADLTRTRVTLSPPPTGSSLMEMAMSMAVGISSAVTAADGTFRARGVVPGKYRANILGIGALLSLAGQGAAVPLQTGWSLKSIMLNGRDVSDVAFEVRPNEDVTTLVATMTDQPTELAGSVMDQAGRPAPGFPIVVFSTDRAYWTIGSRRTQQARPSSDGKYKLVGLPAGEYYVCAVSDLDPASLSDPTFLDQLAAGAFKITLADGEKKTQDLKLGRGVAPASR